MAAKPAFVIGLSTNRSVPWYFWGRLKDAAQMKQLRKDLYLPPGSRPMWWHMAADYDLQSSVPRPDPDWFVTFQLKAR